MILYHGTTSRRARRIVASGFIARKPSRRVWFAKSKRYAEGRAKTQARRAHDRPVVLTCNLDLQRMTARLGARRVFRRAGVVAIEGPVPPSVLRSHSEMDVLVPASPQELARWVNGVLGLKRHKGVGGRHPGIERLSRWVQRRGEHGGGGVEPTELVQLARQWLPEYFEGVEVDPRTLRAVHLPAADVRAGPTDQAAPPADPREDEALACLADERPARRVRGLEILAAIPDPDLFDWCAMFLEDGSPAVRRAALRAMLFCEHADTELVRPLSEADDKNVRAAALAALARHAGAAAPGWFERGLKDPDPCVRVEVAALLGRLDPADNRAIFELARHDSNPHVVALAEKLTAGKGFARMRW